MDNTRQGPPALSGYVITRLLIAAYFMALSIGIVTGTDVSILFLNILPAGPAKLIANGAVFVAALALVLGWYRSIAVFALSAILFFASYISLSEMPFLGLGQFWRDLALIAILMLTYADTDAAGNDLDALRELLPKEEPKAQARRPQTRTRVLSRGSVQTAYSINKSGRAMSRKVRESEARAFSEELEAAAKLR